MEGAGSKENIADGLTAASSFTRPATSPKKASPKKASRKARSKSIGPGGLGAVEEPALRPSSGNRRKSAFIPAVKSILSSNDEDEQKRREARRKSLAKRRVSFAPEATLHTWDVVEYLRDATSSSAASESTRRASNVSQASTHTSPAPDSDSAEPPSTPPEQVEEPEPEAGSSPANQRDLHQKKHRRRSSGIPPMNFNNPDDVNSSSPLSADNASPDKGQNDANGSDDEEDATQTTGRMDTSSDSPDSSQSSARLDEALRQAAAHAGTQRLELEENEDVSMELAEDEVTASFKPWANKAKLAALDNEEHGDPFSQAFAHAAPEPDTNGDQDEDDDGMSMDITRAVGRILPRSQAQSQSPDQDDISMDLTMPLGSIQQAGSKEANRRKSLKRRPSLTEHSQGSPAKRPASRRASLRKSHIPEGASSPEDATMDFTLAIGQINNKSTSEQKVEPSRQESEDGDDETMDLTVAAGSIKGRQPATATPQENNGQQDSGEDEDLSMEFTKVIGQGIKNFNKLSTTPRGPVTVFEDAAAPLESPTPKRLPNESPVRSLAPNFNSIPLLSPQKAATSTPQKSPARPRRSLNNSTPNSTDRPQQRIEDFEPSPFVRSTQSASKPDGLVITPQGQENETPPAQQADDPIAAPILSRRRSSLSSVQFSPLATARDEPTLKSTALLSNNIKLLSTPRKQTLISPTKRSATPKNSHTPQKQPTPKQKAASPKKATPKKSPSPKKHVVFGEEPERTQSAPEADAGEPAEDVERISLQDFLDMTRIRFMDLSTTKRRHTAAPAAFHDKELEDKEETLDQYVVAAACTLPEFELYQHACHEMKKYISDGRHFVRTMEANVLEENPLLFSEYLTAPPDQRAVMDNQFKNLKTSARLEARGEWYRWRSTLLQDLKVGLLATMDAFKKDETALATHENLLDTVLPPLVEQQAELSQQCKALQQRRDELNSCDREELEEAREKLVDTNNDLAEKRRLIAQLQEEIASKEGLIERAKEHKTECIEQIKAAERVREECRGWSTTEVNGLKQRVAALEQAHGWSITSASSSTITMTHLNDLELYFHPSAFATYNNNSPNASISLSYVGDSAAPHPRPLTTSKRFFLQLIRAHLHSIPQSQTRIADLLALVKSSWAAARAVAQGVECLQHDHITEESILADERMAVTSTLLLPTLQTKVKITFDIAVGLAAAAASAATPSGSTPPQQLVETNVDIHAQLVYGEKYSEDKMSAFLRDFCGGRVAEEREMGVWAEGVRDLKRRLRVTGRKGERA